MSPSLYDDKTPEQVQVYDVETEDSNADFTAQEIKRARLKTDFIVLPLVVLMFIFLQFVSSLKLTN